MKNFVEWMFSSWNGEHYYVSLLILSFLLTAFAMIFRLFRRNDQATNISLIALILTIVAFIVMPSFFSFTFSFLYLALFTFLCLGVSLLTFFDNATAGISTGEVLFNGITSIVYFIFYTALTFIIIIKITP